MQGLPSALQSASLAQLPPQPMILLWAQDPVALSQLSIVQASPSLQSLAGLVAHLPPAQPSGPVQGLPSEQPALLTAGVCTQTPLAAWQLSMVQDSPSSQSLAVPDLQALPRH